MVQWVSLIVMNLKLAVNFLFDLQVSPSFIAIDKLSLLATRQCFVGAASPAPLGLVTVGVLPRFPSNSNTD